MFSYTTAVSTTPDVASGSLPSLSPSTTAMSSGDGIPSTTQPLYPITAEPPSPELPEQDSQLSEWLVSTRSWGDDFTQWESFVQSQSGLQLPDLSISDIIARLSNSTVASATRTNSAEWLSLLNNWLQGYDTHAGTFSRLCPKF